jgi:suppressor of ftsI/bilirubin oxidase
VLGAGTLGAFAPARIVAESASGRGADADLCRTPSRFDTPLLVPRTDGLMGRLPIGDRPVLLRAAPRGRDGMLAFAARIDGRDYLDPTFVVSSGARVRLKLENGLDAPTVAHWHGLTVDTANDGNGENLIDPGRSFDYDFTVRNRAGLYWYHPHPHGATASQAYRGLFGLLAVEDDEEVALRRALALVPGETEIPLVLHDRRAAMPGRYAPSDDDLLHGWYGDEALVNFTSRAFLDVAARRYRFRVLNASNARIYRLALRRDDGAPLPFQLIGTDGGLLERGIRVEETFVAPAERIDILADFSGIANGGFVLLESRAFDPMHGASQPRKSGEPAAPGTHAHGGVPGTDTAAASGSDGSAFAMLQFRIRERGSTSPPVPSRLSAPAAVPAPSADERPLRLGFAKGRWRINDRVYDMDATPIIVARAALETWLIRNYHTSMPHAMHLHGFQFRVLERETSPDQLAPLVVDQRGRIATDIGWKDTVLVWPGESVRIAIDFRHPFAGEQIYLFHCHNLEHEDGGMMLRVRVG